MLIKTKESAPKRIEYIHTLKMHGLTKLSIFKGDTAHKFYESSPLQNYFIKKITWSNASRNIFIACHRKTIGHHLLQCNIVPEDELDIYSYSDDIARALNVDWVLAIQPATENPHNPGKQDTASTPNDRISRDSCQIPSRVTQWMEPSLEVGDFVYFGDFKEEN